MGTVLHIIFGNKPEGKLLSFTGVYYKIMSAEIEGCIQLNQTPDLSDRIFIALQIYRKMLDHRHREGSSYMNKRS
jgi:hypothetical protein